MRFTPVKRRGPPSVIIVSLIDVLIVVLIFMMVATTFKQHPAMKLALPESAQTNRGAQTLEQLVVTIAPVEPHLYVGERPVTYSALRDQLQQAATANPRLTLSIRADKSAPWEQVVRVMDAAKASGIKSVSAFTKTPTL